MSFRPAGAVALPPESFAIVRPPPSKGNHPLNVQIQLIAPVAVAAAFARPSGEMSRSDSGTSQPDSLHAVAQASVGGAPASSGLQRSASVRSNRSGRSASSSTGSTLGGGTGRKVTPLYNLSFHAVMTTVVTDAGTDAKIAKFLKRGVEILGLAVIDPVELSPPSSPSPSVALAKSRSPERRTPSSQPTPSEPPTSFLNRFKRLSFKPPSLPAALALPKSDSAASLTTASGQAVVPLFRTPSTEPSPLTEHLTPSISASGVKGYSWTVRKWLRRDLEGKAGVLAAQSVRFEWRRGERKPRIISASPAPSLGPTTDSGHLAATTPEPSSTRPSLERRNSPAPEGEMTTLDPNNLAARKGRPKSWAPGSAGDRRARSPAFGGSDAGGGGGGGGSPDPDEDGNESDPEDSERVWTCEVVYGPKSGSRRLLLGTLSPAPHHPKLVGLLAVPFALSPIALGTFEPGSGTGNEGLSVEEMKDVVCVTCLWLVVREGLGGLGRRRKGDGSWRFG